MSWLPYALLGASLNATFAFLVKLSSGKIHASLGASIFNFSAFILTGVYALWVKRQGTMPIIQSQGALYSALAGLAVGGAGICLYTMLGIGTNISLGYPVYQIGSILLVSVLGILVLKEPISARFLAGAAISLIGLYLLATSR